MGVGGGWAGADDSFGAYVTKIAQIKMLLTSHCEGVRQNPFGDLQMSLKDLSHELGEEKY